MSATHHHALAFVLTLYFYTPRSLDACCRRKKVAQQGELEEIEKMQYELTKRKNLVAQKRRRDKLKQEAREKREAREKQLEQRKIDGDDDSIDSDYGSPGFPGGVGYASD